MKDLLEVCMSVGVHMSKATTVLSAFQSVHFLMNSQKHLGVTFKEKAPFLRLPK